MIKQELNQICVSIWWVSISMIDYTRNHAERSTLLQSIQQMCYSKWSSAYSSAQNLTAVSSF